MVHGWTANVRNMNYDMDRHLHVSNAVHRKPKRQYTPIKSVSYAEILNYSS